MASRVIYILEEWTRYEGYFRLGVYGTLELAQQLGEALILDTLEETDVLAEKWEKQEDNIFTQERVWIRTVHKQDISFSITEVTVIE